MEKTSMHSLFNKLNEKAGVLAQETHDFSVALNSLLDTFHHEQMQLFLLQTITSWLQQEPKTMHMDLWLLQTELDIFLSCVLKMKHHWLMDGHVPFFWARSGETKGTQEEDLNLFPPLHAYAKTTFRPKSINYPNLKESVHQLLKIWIDAKFHFGNLFSLFTMVIKENQGEIEVDIAFAPNAQVTNRKCLFTLHCILEEPSASSSCKEEPSEEEKKNEEEEEEEEESCRQVREFLATVD